MNDLPIDLQYEYLNSLDYFDIVNLCQTDRHFHELCQTPRIRGLIAEKRKLLIKIIKTVIVKTKTPGNLTVIHALQRGNLMKLKRAYYDTQRTDLDDTTFIVTGTSSDSDQLKVGYDNITKIAPIRQISNGYASIDPLNKFIELKMRNVGYPGISGYVWYDNQGYQFVPIDYE